MKRKSASQSAFFNLRVFISLFIILAGVFLALAGFGVFSAANTAQAAAKPTIITKSSDPLVPIPFDCSQIRRLGIDKQENFRAGAIMIACGEAEGGHGNVPLAATQGVYPSSPVHAVTQSIKKLLAPFNYGGTDVDLITGTETFPNITQSETFTAIDVDDASKILIAFNDSRGRNASPINISGASYSTDGGTTFTRLTCTNNQSPFSNTVGDPVVLYSKRSQTWYTVWLDGGSGGQGIGGYKTATPLSCASWTHFTAYSEGSADRESGWVDNNPASPHYGNLYISWNDFAIGGGALFATHSTDDGVTWSRVQVTSSFVRDVQITGDLVTGDVYIAGMNEGGGGLSGPRSNLMFRSTDGGVTWTNTYTGPTFLGPGQGLCSVNNYFASMFGGYWRHMGWGEPAAINHVVHYVYAQHGTGSDAGDVYYIRSTDSGVTFSAPLKLNTDSGTASQWQPNLSVSPSGTVFATWYDTRNGSSNCTPGANTPCYQMFGRKSNDNGVTWLPDMPFSDVVSPLPAQPDPGIVGCYAGDYDYQKGDAATGGATTHRTAWVDGRVLINNASQQDAFTDRELVGFSVTSTNPACNSLVTTQPTQFVVNLSDPADPATVHANAFTVNGIPANSFALSNGNATITFTFNTSPVTTPGPQTMHIPAGAINRASDEQGILDFTCTFCYDTAQLMVTSTNPPVGGTFNPPAPGNYTYDVNFNEAVDPSSVQTSDLTITGNVGGSVTGVTVINGNTTAEFTLHFNNGGSVTLSIAAGAITAHTCNGNAAFSGNYTVSTLQVTGAVSRKTHGAAGTFDINMPLTPPSGVECRSGGGTHDYSLVVTFSDNVNVTGMPQAQVITGMGCVGTGGTCDPNGTVSVSGNVVTVPLTNIADVQVINVQINGVIGVSDEPAVNVNIPMGFLVGDVNGNRTVNSSDVALTKSQVGQPVTGSNFREDVNASGTITSTDVSIVKSDVGHSLANACQLHVLIAYADLGGPPTTLHDQIAAETGVVAVDYFDAASGTPTLAQLQPYQIVFAFSNNAWNNATAMGNVLADYEDGGGVVVVSTFAWDSRGGWLLAGRWITGGYGSYNSTSQINFSTNTAMITMPSHPLMQGVTTLTAFYRNGVTLVSGATSVADWTDGPPAVAFKANNGHTAVSINAYLGQNPMNFSGQWGKTIVNAGRWLLNCTDDISRSGK